MAGIINDQPTGNVVRNDDGTTITWIILKGCLTDWYITRHYTALYSQVKKTIGADLVAFDLRQVYEFEPAAYRLFAETHAYVKKHCPCENDGGRIISQIVLYVGLNTIEFEPGGPVDDQQIFPICYTMAQVKKFLAPRAVPIVGEGSP